MASPILSPELLDTVIDFLHDDVDTLKHCGLVCRQWYPSSRYHLFRSVKFTWLGPYRDECAVGGGTVKGIIQDKLTLAASFVRVLHLDITVKGPFIIAADTAARLSDSPSFPVLTYLTMNSWTRWEGIPISIREWSKRISTGIVFMKIKDITFGARDFLDLMASMGQLEGLALGTSDIKSDTLDLCALYIPPPLLTTLAFKVGFPAWAHCAGTFCTYWINSHRPKSSVSNLKITGLSDAVGLHESAMECISELDISLSNLVLWFRREMGGQHFHFFLSVSCLPISTVRVVQEVARISSRNLHLKQLTIGFPLPSDPLYDAHVNTHNADLLNILFNSGGFFPSSLSLRLEILEEDARRFNEASRIYRNALRTLEKERRLTIVLTEYHMEDLDLRGAGL